ncbi:hypothetical protein TanjilG_15352 [Lupinus angustifolius]|uniref:Uncharacterized protein n=1 Tax=Lupinus angustifolius TaxID=3871 RepID=A0A1J7HNQ4_LUPAN|nr:PREDICTED: uncharacterized protein LOC109342648 [Lupinus angustifolius]OIW14439.1 hypothetical protein TanjilG_15352 [Lupinus angustifolius]
MKREGRQHGMVRSYWIQPSSLNPRSEARYVNRFDSPPTAGLFVKVANKPTNHSKFTGKCTMPRCNSCHLNPSCKSKDKTKGTHKLKHSPIVDRPRSTFFGLSATELLNHLSNNAYIDHEIEDESDDNVDYDENNNDPIHISEIQIQVDQVEDENEDWFLVELSS